MTVGCDRARKKKKRRDGTDSSESRETGWGFKTKLADRGVKGKRNTTTPSKSRPDPKAQEGGPGTTKNLSSKYQVYVMN